MVLITRHDPTDLGNARRLVERHGHELRFCHEQDRWYVWDGRRWAVDRDNAVERRAKDTVRLIYDEAKQASAASEAHILGRWAHHSQSLARIRNLIELARSEPEIVLRPEQLDSHPWKLTVLNGTLNLRDGTLHPHVPSDLITKLAPVSYDGAVAAPRWREFLDQVFGDSDLANYVQRALGYSMTGDTSEQVFFLLYGSGANGKSTLLELIKHMLGDYADSSDAETFLERRSSGPRSDIARLRGARLVTAIEAARGRRFDEPLLKQVTGGDTVTARFLYGAEFTFTPALKLWIAVNQKPEVRGGENALWRRVRLLPFAKVIPEAARDPNLPAALRAESSGILNWLLQGVAEWSKEGLKTPQTIVEATAEYRAEEDTLSQFLEDGCERGPGMSAKAQPLYTCYSEWCEAHHLRRLGQRDFSEAMLHAGCNRRKTKTGWEYVGVRLLLRPAAPASLGDVW